MRPMERSSRPANMARKSEAPTAWNRVTKPSARTTTDSRSGDIGGSRTGRARLVRRPALRRAGCDPERDHARAHVIIIGSDHPIAQRIDTGTELRRRKPEILARVARQRHDLLRLRIALLLHAQRRQV